MHPNQEFLVQYFGDKFGTRLFQTVTNFQLNFEPFRRSFLTQKFRTTWLQIMKQFFKLFHNFITGLWTKNCKQFFKSMVDGPWHNFNQNRVPLRFQYFQYFHVHHPYPKGLGPFNLTHKIWPKWTFTNPYFVTVYAPNVGTPLTLFLRNKKSIRGCDAIEKKMLRIFLSQRSA